MLTPLQLAFNDKRKFSKPLFELPFVTDVGFHYLDEGNAHYKLMVIVSKKLTWDEQEQIRKVFNNEVKYSVVEIEG